MGLVSGLYKAARIANNVDAVMKPKRLPRRAKNVIVGRAAARGGLWKKIWGG